MRDRFAQCQGKTARRLAFAALAAAIMLADRDAAAQGFANVPRTPGELLAGPIAPEQGRTAIVAWHGERIVSVPEPPGSQPGADVQIRVVNISDLSNIQVTQLPAGAGGFHSHGYYHSGAHLFIGYHCMGAALDACNGTFPHDIYMDSFRIGGAGTAIPGSNLRRAAIEEDIGLLLASYQRAGSQAPWGLNDFWTYGAIADPAWIAVRRDPADWVYDWNNGGAATGPAIRAYWNHLAETGVTGFPFIMGNILIWVSDQTGSGVASYDISDLSNPVLLDVLKSENPGAYWPEVYGHYAFLPRRDGEGGPGSLAGFMVVDFEDPTDLRVVANRNLPGLNQYVTFQDEYAFMNRYKIDMRTFEAELSLTLVPGVIDTSQFALPVGNLLVTGGYGSDGPGLAVWAHQAAPDTRGPFVAYHVPRPEQTNYPLELPITLSIPETLRTETIVDGTSLILRPVGGAAIPTWHSFGQGKLLTVTPHDPLLPNATYEFILTSAIQDAAGNGMEPYTFRFSTGSGLGGGNQPPQMTALTTTPTAGVPGAPVTIFWAGMDPDGDDIEFRLDPGDGSAPTTWGAAVSAMHTYAAAGHFQITVQVRDENGAVSARTRTITVIAPPTQTESTASGPMTADLAASRLYAVNPDNNTVAAVDTTALSAVWEAPVGRRPSGIARAADGALWVVCRDADQIDILNAATGALLQSIPLDYGSRPVAIATTPNLQTLLVSCEGDGALRRFSSATRAQTGSVALGPYPRAIAVTHDGSRALVTRFISAEESGQVYDVSLAGAMTLTRTINLARHHATDGGASGRGVPNYLAGIRIAPDGSRAWVVGKKDNTTRGTFFGPLMVPGQDTTVRSMMMLIDLAANAEDVSLRLDLDNSDSPAAIAFSPLGDYAFVALQGNGQVAVIDILDYLQQESPGTIHSRWSAGIAPQGLLVDGAAGRVYSFDFMNRAARTFEAGAFLDGGALNVPSTPVGLVAQERLHPDVLTGKRIFYHASDPRMSPEGYISCATCHVDGAHDGKTWDFTNRGEGFRNTTDLRGRSGTGHGAVHWSANFDEIQDFENDIRDFFGGDGFMSDADFAAASNTLGAPKAGLSASLDALAAYVASLGHASLPRSPFRNPDGTLSAQALNGQTIFTAQGCAVCHIPAQEFTDRTMHDVGTLRASSGNRLGGPLSGIDTPTLLGLHDSAPYFHNGSAATLEEVFSVTGGRMEQAEDGTLLGGAAGEDVDWLPMKEWHLGMFVELDGARQVSFGDVATSAGGAGFVEIRYNVRYAPATLGVSINGGATQTTALGITPNVPNYTPSGWRIVRVPVTWAAGNNAVLLSKTTGGQLVIDDVVFSTPDDRAAAAAHVRNLNASDTADLAAYLRSLDGADALKPAASVTRGATIPPGGTDPVSIPMGMPELVLTYTIHNAGTGPLNLGEFHAESAPAGEIWISQQPAAQVAAGGTTQIEIHVAPAGPAATALIRGASDDPANDPISWTIDATRRGATPAPSATISATPSRTPSPTESRTASHTPSASRTPSLTASRTSSLTPTTTASRTPSPTASRTASPSRSASPTVPASATPGATGSANLTPTSTAAPTTTATPTVAASPTISPTTTPTATPGPPTIFIHPASQSVNAGQNVAFVVAATGAGPLAYQWMKGGSPMGGQAQPSLSLPAAQAVDAGSYRCDVSSPWGVSPSNDALFVVFDPPAANDASYVGATLPAQIPAGEMRMVGVMMRNTSQVTWSAAQGYALSVSSDPDNVLQGAPGGALPLDSFAVVPANGGLHQFVASIQAPAAPGVYLATLRMSEQSSALFGEIAQLTFESIAPQNAAIDWMIYE